MGGIVVKLDGVTLTAPAWLVKPGGDLDLSSAADGSGATGSLIIDDADGTQRIKGWQYITVDEPLCSLANNGFADAPRVFTGYVGRRTYERGPYKSGPGRYIHVELFDSNIVLSTRMANGADAQRPAESDTDRIAWLLGSSYLTGLVQDLGLVNGTGLVYDPINTHGMYPSQVLQDLTGVYDEIFFTYWDQSAEALGLFFDFPNATTNTSPLSISNDLADVDFDAIWAPALDDQLDADPADVYSAVRYVYAFGVFYGHNYSTDAEFFTDNGLVHRDTQIEFTGIGKASTAETFANRFLAAAAHERLTISCTVRLPATHVNLIDAGMRVAVKFTHLPDYGYDDFQYTRVQGREVSQVEVWSPISGELEPWYDVKLTMALTGLPTVGSGGGGPSPSTPPPPSTPPHQTPPPAHFYSGTFPIIGDEFRVANSDLAVITGLQTAAATTVNLTGGVTYNWDITVTWLDTHSTSQGIYLENDDLNSPLSRPILLVYPTDLVEFTATTQHFTGSFTAGATPHNPYRMSGAAGRSPHDHATAASVTFFVDPVGWSPPPDEGPLPGQWSEWKTATMTGATSSTDFPYASGSLEIKVDGVLISPSSYDETDNATGAFTLHWTPDADEVVTYRYQGIMR